MKSILITRREMLKKTSQAAAATIVPAIAACSGSNTLECTDVSGLAPINPAGYCTSWAAKA